jgi:hypothetical protein
MSTITSARDAPRRTAGAVVDHLVERHRHRRVVAGDHVAQRVADEDRVDAASSTRRANRAS